MAEAHAAPATKSDITQLDKRVDQLDKRVDKLDKKVDKLDKKVDKLDKKVDKLDKRIDGVALELVRTQGRMEALAQRLENRMDAGFSRVTGMIDAFLSKLETAERESVTLPATLDEHGKKLRGHDAALAEHDRRLSTLEAPR